MQIDVAVDADVQAIAIIHRAARQRAMPWLPNLHTPEEELWFFRTIVLPKETVWIAKTGSETVGFISVNEGWLNHLYVAPEHWSKGAGTKLLVTAKSQFDSLQLWTFQRNENARRFYVGHGFFERELSDGERNEERVPDVRLIWPHSK